MPHLLTFLCTIDQLVDYLVYIYIFYDHGTSLMHFFVKCCLETTIFNCRRRRAPADAGYLGLLVHTEKIVGCCGQCGPSGQCLDLPACLGSSGRHCWLSASQDRNQHERGVVCYMDVPRKDQGPQRRKMTGKHRPKCQPGRTSKLRRQLAQGVR